MADEGNSTSTPTPPTTSSSWKLPDGIETHIEAGVIKTAVGVVAGGVVGLVMFRGGKGWRAASVAAGIGAAAGSTYERYMADAAKSS